MFRISAAPIDVDACRHDVEDPGAGAFVVFEGWVRDHNAGRTVTSLEYEAYEVLAEQEGGGIVEEARQRFGVLRLCVVHRTGHLAIGDLAVWVGVSAAHRADAFAACQYVMDEVKRRVPIWKREHYAEGSSAWIHNAEAAPAPDGH